MREINTIIVHCSATRENKHFTVEDIDRWHRERGFDCIGYHFVVYLDGTIAPGRPVSAVGAHASGHNAKSIGVCYIGGLDGKGNPKDTRTDAQKRSLHNLLACLVAQFPNATIHGHNEFSNKACPCFDAASEYADIKH